MEDVLVQKYQSLKAAHESANNDYISKKATYDTLLKTYNDKLAELCTKYNCHTLDELKAKQVAEANELSAILIKINTVMGTINGSSNTNTAI